MRKLLQITFLVFGITVIAMMIDLLSGGDVLACLAYYEQCFATEVAGISEQECLARKDFVAWLIQKNICLVK